MVIETELAGQYRRCRDLINVSYVLRALLVPKLRLGTHLLKLRFTSLALGKDWLMRRRQECKVHRNATRETEFPRCVSQTEFWERGMKVAQPSTRTYITERL